MTDHPIPSLTESHQNPVNRFFHQPLIADLVTFLAFFGLYLKTLSPSVFAYDSAELASGVYTLGIVHNTGYPLYLLLAKLFTLIVPFGDIAYRVNLFSALCAALSLAVVRRVALRLSGSPNAALLATAMLGVSYPMWSQAVIAEVYTLHILFLSLILWLALRWRESGRERDLILLALAQGLSFGNHMATVLSLPAVAYLVWASLRDGRTPPPRARAWPLAGLAFLAGPLTYLYLPLRYNAAPAFDYARLLGFDLSTAGGVLSFVRGKTLEHLFFGYGWTEVPRQSFEFLDLVWETYLGAGLLLAILGIRRLWEQDRTLSTAFIVLAGANALFYINFRVFDKNTMFLPVFLVINLWAAVGFREVQDRWKSVAARRASLWGAAVLVALMLALNYPRADLSRNLLTRRFATEVLGQASPQALVLGGWYDLQPIEYLQLVEGVRPDVELFDFGAYTLRRSADLEPGDLSEKEIRRITEEEIRLIVAEQLAQGRPVFSLGFNPALEPAFDQSAVSRWLYAITPAD